MVARHKTTARKPYSLDSVEMIDSWIETDLVHDRNAGVLALLVQGLHNITDVARRHNVLLVADGALDDIGVEGVGDEGDDEIDLGHCGIESLGVGDVEGDRVCIGDALTELLGGLEGTAGCAEYSQSES